MSRPRWVSASAGDGFAVLVDTEGRAYAWWVADGGFLSRIADPPGLLEPVSWARGSGPGSGAASCGDDQCPGYLVNPADGAVHRCDACRVFRTDELAAEVAAADVPIYRLSGLDEPENVWRRSIESRLEAFLFAPEPEGVAVTVDGADDPELVQRLWDLFRSGGLMIASGALWSVRLVAWRGPDMKVAEAVFALHLPRRRQVVCSGCGQSWAVESVLYGRSVKCVSCGASTRLPQ